MKHQYGISFGILKPCLPKYFTHKFSNNFLHWFFSFLHFLHWFFCLSQIQYFPDVWFSDYIGQKYCSTIINWLIINWTWACIAKKKAIVILGYINISLYQNQKKSSFLCSELVKVYLECCDRFGAFFYTKLLIW